MVWLLILALVWILGWIACTIALTWNMPRHHVPNGIILWGFTFALWPLLGVLGLIGEMYAKITDK